MRLGPEHDHVLEVILSAVNDGRFLTCTICRSPGPDFVNFSWIRGVHSFCFVCAVHNRGTIADSSVPLRAFEGAESGKDARHMAAVLGVIGT